MHGAGGGYARGAGGGRGCVLVGGYASLHRQLRGAGIRGSYAPQEYGFKGGVGGVQIQIT
jgi:hypothetical protein